MLTKEETILVLIVSFLIMVAVVLAYASDAMRLWMLCSVFASAVFPSLFSYFLLRKESKDQQSGKTSAGDMQLYYWQVYGWKHLFVDSELILIGIILGLDTIGDVANALIKTEQSAYASNILGIQPFTLTVFIIVEFFIIIIMTLTYSVETKETFSRMLGQTANGPVENMTPRYNNQLLTVFSQFFGNLLYLVVIQYCLSTLP